MKPFVDSSSVANDGAELARRMKRDGYLYVAGLLPPERLEALRMKFLRVASRASWLHRDAPLEQAIADLDAFCVEPEPAYMEQYHDMYIIEDFHALQHHPSIVGLLERMCGDTILPHARLIGRLIFPQQDAFTTPPHQDFIPIQGTPDTYTAWFPLADLPPTMGGLEIAAGSHRAGIYDFRPALGAGGIEITDPLNGCPWVNSPFAQGDVLFFHSMAVHRGRPNRDIRLRLSIDARYQRVNDPINPSSLEPHSQPHTWEEIYAEWPPDSPFKYYWRKWDLHTVAYDTSYHDRRDQMAMEMAKQGDPNSRSTLERIVARDADPQKREQARLLLTDLEATRA